MFRGLTAVFFYSLWTGAACLSYLSDTRGHRRNFVKSEWAPAVLSNL